MRAQFDSIRAQIDQLAADASFNGTNLINGGSLKVIFNEKSTSSLTVAGVTDTSAGLGIAASTNTFQTDKDINDALTNLKNSLNTLRSHASVFATNIDIVTTRQDFTKSLISALNAASDSLTAADTNEEGANLLALQTRQQLSSTALSFATAVRSVGASPVPLTRGNVKRKNGGASAPPFCHDAIVRRFLSKFPTIRFRMSIADVSNARLSEVAAFPPVKFHENYSRRHCRRSPDPACRSGHVDPGRSRSGNRR